MTKELIGVLTVPLFCGVIGYVTNWTGVWMLFNPVHFRGLRLPGLRALAQILPRRIQQVPGIMVGGIGWQGIIPSRAAKMGSIAVDKGIAKVGTPAQFFERLDSEELAAHIVDSVRDDVATIVDEVMERERPDLWRELTPELREALHGRVQDQLPETVDAITAELGRNIDHLLDLKLMVIRYIERHPELANKLFRSVGERELRFIVNFGFYFGFAMGIPIAGLTALFGTWILIFAGPVLGWVTNWLALLMIFEPPERRRYGPFHWQGLFLRRQREVADVYADVVAEDIVTLPHIAEELQTGVRADRTREMIVAALRPSIDRALGDARPLVRLAVGPSDYDTIRESVAERAADQAIEPLADDELGRRQGERIEQLLAERMREMPATEFADMLRSAIRQDEWLLLAHGGALGVFGGLVHYFIFA